MCKYSTTAVSKHSGNHSFSKTRVLPTGVGAFRPKFYWNGVIPCQNVDTIRYVVDCATTLSLEVFRQKEIL